jgi:hypothetical protein
MIGAYFCLSNASDREGADGSNSNSLKLAALF